MLVIPWAKPDYWGKERQYVDEAMESTWISGGPFVERIEQHFTDLSGGGHALAVSNGTITANVAAKIANGLAEVLALAA